MLSINEQVRNAIDRLNTDVIRPRVRAEKSREFAKAQKADLYFRGLQYLKPLTDGVNPTEYMPVSEYRAREGDDSEFVNDYVVNNYRALARKFASVLGGKAPSLKAIPLRDDDDKAMRMSKHCDLLALDFNRRWDRDSLHMDLTHYIFKYSTTWIYTPWNVDRNEYGQTTIEDIEQQDVQGFDEDGFETTESRDIVVKKTFDNGYVECHIVPSLEATCPGGIKDIKQAPWFIYEREEYVGAILNKHPEWREVVLEEAGKHGVLETSLEGRRLRDQVSSPFALEYYDGPRDRVTVSKVWLAPGTMLMLEGEDAEDILDNQLVTLPVHEMLSRKFPRGVRATYIGETLVDLFEENLVDVWTPCKPEISDTLECDGVGYDYLGIADICNDLANLIVETVERSAPLMIADPTVLDSESLASKPASPGSFVLTTPGSGDRKGIYAVGGSEVDPRMGQILQFFHEIGSDIIGIRPEIYGGGAGSHTAEEARIKATQALRQLGITWKQMRTAWQMAAWKAVQQLARHFPGVIEVSGEVINPDDLLDAEIRFEAQEQMPQTFSELRDALREWVTLGPDAWTVFGVNDPRNAEALEQYLSVTGWKFPKADEIAKLNMVISQLKDESPVQDPMTGQPMASQPAEPEIDDPGLVVELARVWAASPAGMRVKQNKPEGYQNVLLWRAAYQQALQQQQMQEMMMQQGIPPGGQPGPGGPPAAGPQPPPEMGALEPMQMNPPIDPLTADPNMPMPPNLMVGADMPGSPMAEQLMR